MRDWFSFADSERNLIYPLFFFVFVYMRDPIGDGDFIRPEGT
jgi:hypothetical protein